MDSTLFLTVDASESVMAIGCDGKGTVTSFFVECQIEDRDEPFYDIDSRFKVQALNELCTRDGLNRFRPRVITI